jgi:hypothetical protein
MLENLIQSEKTNLTKVELVYDQSRFSSQSIEPKFELEDAQKSLGGD